MASKPAALWGRSHSHMRPPTDICFRCGCSGHHDDPNKCPAISRTCNSCGKTGHFAHICQASRKTQCSGNTGISKYTVRHTTFKVSAIRGWNYDLHFILLSGQLRAIPTRLDTGADTMLVSSSVYDAYLKDFLLSDPPCTLFNFDGSPIKGVRGMFQAPISHEGCVADLVVYVIPDHMESICRVFKKGLFHLFYLHIYISHKS